MLDQRAYLTTKLALCEARDAALARESFLHFYMRMTGFFPAAHHKVICKLIQAMDADKIDRAMLFMPPRHGKTLLATTLAPAWIMGRRPETPIMVIAHTGDYALQLGGQIRNMLKRPEWPFQGVDLAEDSQAKDRWRTDQGGQVNTFGAGAGNQHGRPAEWLIMDDVVKGREMAMSAHQRNTVWENYVTDLRTRLQGRRKQLFVYTRWHEDDPAGRILPDGWGGRTGWVADRETGEPWYVLSMPAVAEHDNDPLGRQVGDWLWPEAFGEAQLGPERARGGWQWSALYQQRPSPEEGLMFSAEHISHRYTRGGLDMTAMQIYISSDYAVTAEAGANDPDWTVHMVWGVGPDFRIYLLDIWRGRTTADVWVEAWLNLVRRWKPLRAFEENGQIIKGVGPFLKRRMLQERVFVDRVQITSSVSKEQRAHGLLGVMAEGRVFLPRRDECTFLNELDAFEKELLQFPTGRHDDTVDAATLFGRVLDRIVEGVKPARLKIVSPHGPSIDDLWSAHDEARERREVW